MTRKTYEENNQTVIEAYKKYMKNIFSEFTTKPVQDDDINKIFQIEEKLAKVTLDSAERRNQTFKNFTIRDFNAEYQGVIKA